MFVLFNPLTPSSRFLFKFYLSIFMGWLSRNKIFVPITQFLRIFLNCALLIRNFVFKMFGVMRNVLKKLSGLKKHAGKTPYSAKKRNQVRLVRKDKQCLLKRTSNIYSTTLYLCHAPERSG